MNAHILGAHFIHIFTILYTKDERKRWRQRQWHIAAHHYRTLASVLYSSCIIDNTNLPWRNDEPEARKEARGSRKIMYKKAFNRSPYALKWTHEFNSPDHQFRSLIEFAAIYVIYSGVPITLLTVMHQHSIKQANTE